MTTTPDDESVVDDYLAADHSADNSFAGYLLAALDELGRCHDWFQVVTPGMTWVEPPGQGREVQLRYVMRRRNVHTRNAVLLTAFAVEALANNMFQTTDEQRAQRFERIRPLEKFDLSLGLAGKPSLAVGTEPMTSMDELFRLRNEFAHPKGPKSRRTCKPSQAMRFIVQSAKLYALVQLQIARDGGAELAVSAIHRHENWLTDFARRWDSKLPDMDSRPGGLLGAYLQLAELDTMMRERGELPGWGALHPWGRKLPAGQKVWGA